MVNRSTVSPPTNLAASVIPGKVTLSWGKSTSVVDGYRIYQNGSLIGSTPAILPLFEFPFSNESLITPLIIFSEGEDFSYEQTIEPKVQYTFEVCAFIGADESTRVSVNVYYEHYILFTSVSLSPNPVDVDGSLLINASVDTGINVTIT